MAQEEPLQFDRAEFSEPSSAECAQCKRQLHGSYYEVNGHTVCEACRYAIEASSTSGSGLGRFARALGAGLGAAILGSLLYYAIAALTGYELGLIAIVVGFGVGSAVRWGSGGRGGRGYQALAIALTYLAIVSTYIPPILEGLSKTDVESSSTEKPGATSAASSQPEAKQAGVGVLLLGLLVILAIACAAPFLLGAQNIMGIIIIGIGLYEAWKLNKRVELTITGPHVLSSPRAETASV